jgi:hypothetical protein
VFILTYLVVTLTKVQIFVEGVETSLSDVRAVEIIEHVKNPKLWKHPRVESPNDLLLKLRRVREAKLSDMIDVRREFGSFLIVDIGDGYRFWTVVGVFGIQVVNASFLAGDSIVGVVEVRHVCRGELEVEGSPLESR